MSLFFCYLGKKNKEIKKRRKERKKERKRKDQQY